MKTRSNDLKVDLPRFNADYSTRQRILDNVILGRKGGAKPRFNLLWVAAVAAILLLVFIQPRGNFGIPLMPGSDGLRLAADWHQAASDNNLLDKEAIIMGLNINWSEGKFRYNLRMLVNIGPRWDEYVLSREGQVVVTRAGSRLTSPANYPDASLLRLLDQISLEDLVDKSGVTIVLDPGASRQVWWGPGNVLVTGARQLTDIHEQWVEFNGPFSRLVISQGNMSTNYLIPRGNYSLHDLGPVYRLMERQLKAEAIFDISRFSGGWQVDAQLPEGRALVMVPDDAWGDVTVNYWDQPRYGAQQIRQLITADTGLEVLDTPDFSGGYWWVAVSYRGLEHRIRVADRDGHIVYRDFDLIMAVSHGETVWYQIQEQVYAWPIGLGPVLGGRGTITGLAGLPGAVVVEYDSKNLVIQGLEEPGNSIENLPLNLVRFSPQGNVLLLSDDVQHQEKVSALSGKVWLAYGNTLESGNTQVNLASEVRDALWIDHETIALLLGDKLVVYHVQDQTLTSFPVDSRSLIRMEAAVGGLMIASGRDNEGEVRFWHRDRGMTTILETYGIHSEEFVKSASYSGRYLFYREDINRSQIRLFDFQDKRYGRYLIGDGTPLWLNSNTLAVVGYNGVRTLDPAQLIK